MSDQQKSSGNDRVPDKAQDYDDDLETTTFSADSQDEQGLSFARGKQKPQETNPTDQSSEKTTVFERAGRAEPQTISPNNASSNTTEAHDNQRVDERPEYRDEDFARTEVVDPAGKKTTAPPQQTEYLESSGTENQVQPQPAPTHQPYAEGTGATAAADERQYVDGRRGTIDFGLFLFRIGFSAWLIIQAVATFFTLGNSDGVQGLEAEFGGYEFPTVLAIAVPVMQLAAGVFLLLGLLAPIAATVALVATGFMFLHTLTQTPEYLNVFTWEPTLWVAVMALFAALTLQFTGPGLYSLDATRSWARRPLASSWIFAIIGIAAVGVAWFFLAGVNPLAN